MHSVMEFALARNYANFPTSIPIKYLSSKGYLYKFTLAGQQHLRCCNDAIELHILNLMLA